MALIRVTPWISYESNTLKRCAIWSSFSRPKKLHLIYTLPWYDLALYQTTEYCHSSGQCSPMNANMPASKRCCPCPSVYPRVVPFLSPAERNCSCMCHMVVYFLFFQYCSITTIWCTKESLSPTLFIQPVKRLDVIYFLRSLKNQ